jgi:signal transduction histidine kinase
MKVLIRLLSNVVLVCICLGLFLVFSCNSETKKKQDKKPWSHKDVMPQKLKWFLSSDNYNDSNYQERFENYYNGFLSQNQTDSALFYLLTYGEMTDQNYLNDSFFLDKALAHLKKYEPISTENGELIKLYYYIGSQYEIRSQYDLAKDWFNKGIIHPNVLPRTKIKCMGMLADIYISTNEPEKALPLQLERLTYYENEKDTVNIGVAYANISNTYNALNANNLGIQYIKKAIDCAKLKHDTTTLIVYISNYFILLKNDDPNFEFTPSLKNEIHEFNSICNAYSNLSAYNEWVRQNLNFYYYLKMEQLDSMKITLNKLDEVRKILNNPAFDNRYEFMLTHYNNKRGDINLDVKKLTEMADFFEKHNMGWEAFRLYMMLEIDAKQKSDFKNALTYNNKIHELELARIKKNLKGQIYEMDVKYQSAKKDQEILMQAEKIKLEQRNIGLLIAGLVITILSFTIYFVWQNKKIIAEKRKIETLFTQKLMENTEDERMRIAKDLHDSIGHELLNVKSAISNKLQFTEDKIDHILAEVREISRNLFPVMFEEIGLKISVEQLIDQITKSDDLFVMSEINYLPGTLNSKVELNIYRIIQEALSNVRKYAKAQSAKVSIIQTNEDITVEIKDNGQGFDVMEVLKLGKAFGLMSINQRCLALNSAVSIESNANGTVISFQIKL